MNINKIIDAIKEIKTNLNFVESEIINKNMDRLPDKDDEEFNKLKNLLETTYPDIETWPEAVLPFQVVDQNSETEKMERAEGIIDSIISEEITDKKFLDFGCGEGHMAKYVSSITKNLCVGYDIKINDKSKFTWEIEENNLLLTTDIKKVMEKKSYDIILIYDVIDHVEQNDPVDILIEAASLLSDGGRIYLRCHPWCGRHGGHLYRKINKAFVHIIFSNEELISLGADPEKEEKIIKVIFPMDTYKDYIKKSGLKIISEHIEFQEVEGFFQKIPILSKRLRQNIKIDNGKTFPKHQLSQCFHDYILTK